MSIFWIEIIYIQRCIRLHFHDRKLGRVIEFGVVPFWGELLVLSVLLWAIDQYFVVSMISNLYTIGGVRTTGNTEKTSWRKDTLLDNLRYVKHWIGAAWEGRGFVVSFTVLMFCDALSKWLKKKKIFFPLFCFYEIHDQTGDGTGKCQVENGVLFLEMSSQGRFECNSGPWNVALRRVQSTIGIATSRSTTYEIKIYDLRQHQTRLRSTDSWR